MKRYLAILLYSILSVSLWAQEISVITGRITDSLTGEPLIGAGIITGEGSGTVSDTRGRYIVKTGERQITILFQYLGYRPKERIVQTTGPDTIFLNVRLYRSVTALDEIVVSAGKYEQRLSDVMVSVDIIKPERITNTGTTSLETIIRQTPGVEILDGQSSIRGGSGYSYGAGSRVMVLIDDLPILTGDVGDVKWDYLPVENIEQIEIIKGASSVLYGSSALNGVFNIRTRYPVDVPKTRISIYPGIYMKPARKEWAWWDKQPYFAGMDFSHRRKIRNLDLVLGGNLFRDTGYREDEYQNRTRLNIGIRHRNRSVEGLNYGINMNGMLIDKSDFLLWLDEAYALRQNQQSVSALHGHRFNFDPFIDYRGRSGDRHSLKTRFYHIRNNFYEATDKNNRSSLVYGEYKYYREFAERVKTTFGMAGTWTKIFAGLLYGDHTSLNQAVFGQADVKLLARLKASVGLRLERYVLDAEIEYSTPVFRAGLNYQVHDHSYLRASFGQGYRFPSVAEKYTETYVGSVRILPNTELISEKGWSAELGFKQGLKIDEWQGYLDVAAFWSEYDNMIEFSFGRYLPDIPGLGAYGFKAWNLENSRIMGAELCLYGNGKIRNVPVSLMAGYTYMYPVDLNAADSAGGNGTDFLKYRYQHSVKSDAEVSFWRFALGCTFIYNSRMERIDDVFTDNTVPPVGNLILPGFPGYWEENNTGYAVLDARMLCNITSFLSAGLIVKNILNTEYMGRPGDIQPPRNITLRLTAEF
jgi:iron complex outermembrane receptor protein